MMHQFPRGRNVDVACAISHRKPLTMDESFDAELNRVPMIDWGSRLRKTIEQFKDLL